MIMFYLFVGFHGMRIKSSAEEILTSRIILLELYLNCIYQKRKHFMVLYLQFPVYVL